MAHSSDDKESNPKTAKKPGSKSKVRLKLEDAPPFEPQPLPPKPEVAVKLRKPDTDTKQKPGEKDKDHYSPPASDA
jgi:hypothetical protein